MPRIFRHDLLAHLRAQFQVDWAGYHGAPHWARVRHNGLLLAPGTGANAHVVELFAFFHDARRRNEGEDEDHGRRGAGLARELRGQYFEASDAEMELLLHACTHHSDGLTEGDPTVQTCWDADRLDLARVGITPAARYLCTAAARDPAVIAAAVERSRAWVRRWRLREEERDQRARAAASGVLDLSEWLDEGA